MPLPSNKKIKVYRCIRSKLFFEVDGEWSEWENWTECSVSCGNGTILRKRACSDPLPDNGGKYCNGSDTEVARCNMVPCKGI